MGLGVAGTPKDSLAPFNEAILAIRWVTTAVSLAVAAPLIAAGDLLLIAFSVALITYTAVRTIRPLRYEANLAGLLAVLAEAAVILLALVATGYWASPLAFAMVAAVALAAFARGFGFGLLVALASSLAVSLAWALVGSYAEDDLRMSVQWSVQVVLVALVAGYARRLSGEADERQVLALDRLGRLADANALLFALHEVAQSLPASLDLNDVLDTEMTQIMDLFDAQSAFIILRDDTDRRWHAVRSQGGRWPAPLDDAELPGPLRRAIESGGAVRVQNLLAVGDCGVRPSSGSGLYGALTARGTTIGVVAIEHDAVGHFPVRDCDLLAGFLEPAALAIDNARWFGRLRTMGAEEERMRIARDLHDRIGQSLAYLAFELDRIVKSGAGRTDITALAALRKDMRGVIGDVRDTLYDLRTDVTESQSISSTLEGFLQRVQDRSGLLGHLRLDETGRLPILQERELWRIAQEAVINVERHARAHSVNVSWCCDGTRGTLEIADDGVGFPVGRAGRLDSYGLTGMRERASSIGAALVIDSEPGRGTRVLCTLEGR